MVLFSGFGPFCCGLDFGLLVLVNCVSVSWFSSVSDLGFLKSLYSSFVVVFV